MEAHETALTINNVSDYDAFDKYIDTELFTIIDLVLQNVIDFTGDAEYS